MSLRWCEPWQCFSSWNGTGDSTTFIDLYGPDGHAGRVVAHIQAAQADLLPAGPDDESFFQTCTHIVARDVRRAYEAGGLGLDSGAIAVPGTGGFSVTVDLAEVRGISTDPRQLAALIAGNPTEWPA